MTKKLFLSCLLTLLPLLVRAYDAKIDGIYYDLISFDGSDWAEVTFGDEKYSGAVDIPSLITYNGVEYSLTAIGEKAFYDCRDMTSINIPNTVITIGKQAFNACKGLKSITIPNSVITIDNSAFFGCTGLASITIPNSVTRIGGSVFESCSGLKRVSIGNSITAIEKETFSYCSSLTSITIPNSVTSIAYGAFKSCIGLTSVTIGNSVTSIDEWAFGGCTGLINITIPNSVTSIGRDAFADCSSLTSVTIGSGVKNIGEYAFTYCQQIKEVYCLADAVPLTASSAFSGVDVSWIVLYVPETSINDYKNTIPWNRFKEVKALERCATPTISYANGKLKFACETEGVMFVHSVTFTPDPLSHGFEVDLRSAFTVVVYARREGYQDSEKAEMTINMPLNGDMNEDGKLSIEDVTKLVKKIMEQ